MGAFISASLPELTELTELSWLALGFFCSRFRHYHHHEAATFPSNHLIYISFLFNFRRNVFPRFTLSCPSACIHLVHCWMCSFFFCVRVCMSLMRSLLTTTPFECYLRFFVFVLWMSPIHRVFFLFHWDTHSKSFHDSASVLESICIPNAALESERIDQVYDGSNITQSPYTHTHTYKRFN